LRERINGIGQTLGWEPAQPRLLDDLDNGHYFPAG
jgi:hypothetical protein